MLEKLKEILGKFARRAVADKAAVEELAKEIQRTLVQADVDVKLAADLAARIKEQAMEEKLPAGLTRREHVVNIVYKELVRFLGAEKPQVKIAKQRILLLGLFGSGKTTMTAKLARFYQRRGLSVGVIGADVWRPAAFEQLSQLCKQANIEVYGEPGQKDPLKIVKAGSDKFKTKEVVIVDSAGRSALDAELRAELKKIADAFKPEEKLLVVSADIGQAAGKQATSFNELVGLSGVIVTKTDSSARGGGALSTCAAAGVPVKFIGVGEKIDDLELYDPLRFVSRLLGMGDLQLLLEKAKTAMTPEKAKRILEGEFTMDEFIGQIEAMTQIGPMRKILEMIPGMGGLADKVPQEMLGAQEDKMKRWKHLINSMTPAERARPDILDSSRINRIARGAGARPEEIRELLRNYEAVKKVMKKAKSGKLQAAMKKGGFGKSLKGLGFGI